MGGNGNPTHGADGTLLKAGLTRRLAARSGLTQDMAAACIEVINATIARAMAVKVAEVLDRYPHKRQGRYDDTLLNLVGFGRFDVLVYPLFGMGLKYQIPFRISSELDQKINPTLPKMYKHARNDLRNQKVKEGLHVRSKRIR